MAKNYLLACLANKGELGRVDVWKITNQQLSLAFERKAKSLLKIVSLTCLNTDKVSFENRNETSAIFLAGVLRFEIRENGIISSFDNTTRVFNNIYVKRLTRITYFHTSLELKGGQEVVCERE